MPRAKQLTLQMPDRPGLLGEIATALGEKKININGMTAAAMQGGGMVWMVVDKTAAAKKVFGQRGWNVQEDEVVAVPLTDSPGALGRYASKLGKAGINITFMYVGSAGSARRVTGYFGVSDIKAALKVKP